MYGIERAADTHEYSIRVQSAVASEIAEALSVSLALAWQFYTCEGSLIAKSIAQSCMLLNLFYLFRGANFSFLEDSSNLASRQLDSCLTV